MPGRRPGRTSPAHRASVDFRRAGSREFDPKTKSTRVAVHLTSPVLRSRPANTSLPSKTVLHSLPMSSRFTKKLLVSASGREPRAQRPSLPEEHGLRNKPSILLADRSTATTVGLDETPWTATNVPSRVGPAVGILRGVALCLKPGYQAKDRSMPFHRLVGPGLRTVPDTFD